MRRRFVGLLVVVVTLWAAPWTSAADRPLVAAHRGGAGLWPENSLLAFRNALALGVDALEFDLHLTSDGEVVVIHDATLDRTTTGTGAVRARTLAEIRTVRIKARDGVATDERVPTFAELLDLAAPSTVELLPEIKIDADNQPYPGIEEKVLGLIRAGRLMSRVTIQAFQASTIARLRGAQPDVRTMLLVSRRSLGASTTPAEAVQWGRRAGVTDLGMEFRAVDPAVVAAARGARIRLSVWTVNDESDIRRMIDLGAHVIMSDRPDVVKRLVSK